MLALSIVQIVMLYVNMTEVYAGYLVLRPEWRRLMQAESERAKPMTVYARA